MPYAIVQSNAAQTNATVVAAAAGKTIHFRVVHFSCVGAGKVADLHEETSGTKYAVTSGSFTPPPMEWRTTDTANKALQVTSDAGSSVEVYFEYR